MEILFGHGPQRIGCILIDVVQKRLQASAVFHGHHQSAAVLDDIEHSFRAVDHRHAGHQHADTPVSLLSARSASAGLGLRAFRTYLLTASLAAKSLDHQFVLSQGLGHGPNTAFAVEQLPAG